MYSIHFFNRNTHSASAKILLCFEPVCLQTTTFICCSLKMYSFYEWVKFPLCSVGQAQEAPTAASTLIWALNCDPFSPLNTTSTPSMKTESTLSPTWEDKVSSDIFTEVRCSGHRGDVCKFWIYETKVPLEEQQTGVWQDWGRAESKQNGQRTWFQYKNTVGRQLWRCFSASALFSFLLLISHLSFTVSIIC